MPTDKKGKSSVKKHIVVFQDQEGNVLKTSFIPDGQPAKAPEVASVIGESAHYKTVFSRWSEDFSQVRQNMVLQPIYIEEAKKYLVMYYHEDGKLIGMESVSYGSPAKQPYKPKKPSDEQFDYPFLGWSVDLKAIQGDTNAKALFGKMRRSFPVRFFHEDGRLIKEEKILYGKAAHPPLEVEKKEDPTFRYQFAGWDFAYDSITRATDIYAKFSSIYKDYRVRFFEGENLKEEVWKHYEDPITFPMWKKKGYTLVWDRQEKVVKQNEEFTASWAFANYKNRLIENEQGLFQIVNPSISSGSVRCLSYYDKKSHHVKLPEKVKLGDYYYCVEEIGPRCFADCCEMIRLTLPDTVKWIDAFGLASCQRVKQIEIGKGIRKIGRKAFCENEHLKEIRFRVKEVKFRHKNAFDGVRAQTELIYVK